MPRLTVPRRFARMTLGQMAWALSGFAVLITVVIVARGDLNGLYKSQPDFFIGSLLSFTGFALAKAFSRASVTAAVDHIHDARTPEVARALEEATHRWMRENDIPGQVALLRRNIDAAAQRCGEYYDLQAKDPRGGPNVPLLRVVLTDLDDALSSAAHLSAVVGAAVPPVFTLSSGARIQLKELLRDVREAASRRQEAFDAVSMEFGHPTADELWGAFTVLSSDTLKSTPRSGDPARRPAPHRSPRTGPGAARLSERLPGPHRTRRRDHRLPRAGPSAGAEDPQGGSGEGDHQA
ncbi:hypothetical protein GCM10027589_10600 [Actinocorallia lasiicapitis]